MPVASAFRQCHKSDVKKKRERRDNENIQF